MSEPFPWNRAFYAWMTCVGLGMLAGLLVAALR
jgi:hypothetical protein